MPSVLLNESSTQRAPLSFSCTRCHAQHRHSAVVRCSKEEAALTQDTERYASCNLDRIISFLHSQLSVASLLPCCITVPDVHVYLQKGSISP